MFNFLIFVNPPSLLLLTMSAVLHINNDINNSGSLSSDYCFPHHGPSNRGLWGWVGRGGECGGRWGGGVVALKGTL